MTVRRPLSHPLCPPGYPNLKAIYERYGCSQLQDIDLKIPWMRIDIHKVEDNSLDLWIKKLKK